MFRCCIRREEKVLQTWYPCSHVYCESVPHCKCQSPPSKQQLELSFEWPHTVHWPTARIFNLQTKFSNTHLNDFLIFSERPAFCSDLHSPFSRRTVASHPGARRRRWGLDFRGAAFLYHRDRRALACTCLRCGRSHSVLFFRP